MRIWSTAVKERIANRLKKEVWPLLDKGKCKPFIYRVFELHEVAAAHKLVKSREYIAKSIIKVGN